MENSTASGRRPLVALLGGSDTTATGWKELVTSSVRVVVGGGGGEIGAGVGGRRRGGSSCTAMVGRAACSGARAGVLNSSGSGHKE